MNTSSPTSELPDTQRAVLPLLNVPGSGGTSNRTSTTCLISVAALWLSPSPVVFLMAAFLICLIFHDACGRAMTNLQIVNLSVTVIGEDNRLNRKLTRRLKKGNKFMKVSFAEDVLGLLGRADLLVRMADKRIDVVSARTNSTIWSFEHRYYLWQMDPDVVDSFADRFEELFGEDTEYYDTVVQHQKQTGLPLAARQGKQSWQLFEQSSVSSRVFSRGEILMVLGLQAEGVTESDAKTVSNLLQTAIINCKLFRVVERQQIEMILKEKALELAICDEAECAAKLGHMLNSNKVILGSVGKLADIFHINIRAVNTSTGEVIYADRVECESLNNIGSGISRLTAKLLRATR